MSVRVLLADGHEMFRQGICEVFARGGEVEVVAQAGTGEEALRAIQTGVIDVAVIDTALIDGPGIELIRKVAAEHPRTRCIALSPVSSRFEFDRAMRAGAVGFGVKANRLEELRTAILAVHSGRCFVSPAVAGHLVHALNEGADTMGPTPLALTRRERDVLRLVADGRSSREIATSLGVSKRTVETHRSRLMAKLDIHKTASLVRFAVREGLVGA